MLTEGQKKLPPALQRAILAKKGKGKAPAKKASAKKAPAKMSPPKMSPRVRKAPKPNY